MKDIMKIVKYLEDSCVLIKDILLGTLDSSLLGNIVTGKGMTTAGNGVYRAGQDF